MSCNRQILGTVQRKVPTDLKKVKRAGYSCQTSLINAVRSHYPSGTRYYLWFNIDFNPHSVDLTSRPLHIYEDLDIAVQTRSTSHPKIRGFRIKYGIEIDAVIKDDNERRKLKKRVTRADITWFRPTIVKLDLADINLDDCRQNAINAGATRGEGRDEYLCKFFPDSQYYVIVE